MLEEEMYLDLLVFKGVAARTRHCKMKTLDLRGLEISMGTSVAVASKKSSFNQCVTFLIVLLWVFLFVALKTTHLRSWSSTFGRCCHCGRGWRTCASWRTSFSSRPVRPCLVTSPVTCPPVQLSRFACCAVGRVLSNYYRAALTIVKTTKPQQSNILSNREHRNCLWTCSNFKAFYNKDCSHTMKTEVHLFSFLQDCVKTAVWHKKWYRSSLRICWRITKRPRFFPTIH